MSDPYTEIRVLCGLAAILFAASVALTFLLYRGSVPPTDRRRRK